MKFSTFMLNFGSYTLYLLLLTIRYSTFGFTLDIKISTCYVTFTLLSLTSYALYLLLLTICQFAFGFTFRYKIRKIIQSSVLSFLGVLKIANFLLSFFSFSVVPFIAEQKPVVRIFSTNYAKFFCLFLWLCILCCMALGNIARVYPWIIQGLMFYQHRYKNKILACVVQVDTFIISL